jgi:sulfur carrier protein ThiS
MAQRAEAGSSGDTIEVKVAVLGGEVKVIDLPEGSTVRQALEAAGRNPDSRVKVNGEEYSGDDVVEDGDKLYIVDSVKGGR